MHQNPVIAGLVNLPEAYYYSSAKFYELGIDDFNILRISSLTKKENSDWFKISKKTLLNLKSNPKTLGL